MIKNVWEKLKSGFYLDLRSLALFRVLFAFAMIIDLIRRSSYLEAHYSAWGAIPPSIPDSTNRYCLHCVSGSTQFQALLFIIAGLVNLSLMVGYKTRLSTILSFILLSSLQNRNHYVMDGSDDYTRVTLFWSIFLPLSKYYSIDSLKLNKIKKRTTTSSNGNRTMTVTINDGSNDQITQEILLNDSSNNKDHSLMNIKEEEDEKEEVEKKKNVKSNQIITVGTVGVLLQFFYIYYFTARLKSGPTWHVEYNAVYYALNLLEFRFRLAEFFLQYQFLITFLTRGTLIFEYLGPVFIFSPIFNTPLRFISILGFIGMHFGFGICLNLYQFIYIPMIVTLMFLPSIFWERAREYFLESPRKKVNEITIHYYHGKLSQYSERKVETFLKVFKTLFLEPFMKVKQVHHQKSLYNNNFQSTFAVQYKNETVYEPYQSFQLLLSNSFLLFPLSYKFIYNNLISKFLIENLFKYLLIDDNDNINSNNDDEKKFKGKSIFKQYKSITNTIVKVFCIYVIVYSFYYNHITMNIETLGSPKFIEMANILKMDQYWGMFAPDPPTVSRWTMIAGQFEKNPQDDIDLLKDDYSTKVDFSEKAPYLFNSGQRFRNYITNAAYFEGLKLNYGRYICRTHNIYNEISKVRGKLLNLKIYIVTVPTIPHSIFYSKNSTGGGGNEEESDRILNFKPLSYSIEVVWDHVC